jgi:hypothetical protein
LSANAVPEFMRAVLGDEVFRNVERVATTLTDLERCGAISAEWHTKIIEEIAQELVDQQIANDVASESLPDEGLSPDTAGSSCRP